MLAAMPRDSRRGAKDGFLFFLAVFLMFAPIGVLMTMVQSEPGGWVLALGSAAAAGVISVGWAYAAISRRWWLLVPLFLAQFYGPRGCITALQKLGLLDVGMDMSPRARLAVLAVMCVVFTAAGFTLFVVQLRVSERRSARAFAELEVAGRVHSALVPPISLRTATAEVYGRSVASSSMGGDLIDLVCESGDRNRVDVLIGDVSGHGVGAGIVMAMLKSCVRMRLMGHAALGDVVADVNRVLAELTEPGMFATFVALRIAPGRCVEFALAGHLPILHYRAATGRWERHPNESLPLGIDGAERFSSGTAEIGRGDILAVFTDGLTEVQNPSGRELGLEGVAALLAGAPRESLEAMHASVMAGVAAHGPQIDDQSLVLVRVG
jgi:hypothetical protein